MCDDISNLNEAMDSIEFKVLVPDKKVRVDLCKNNDKQQMDVLIVNWKKAAFQQNFDVDYIEKVVSEAISEGQFCYMLAVFLKHSVDV